MLILRRRLMISLGHLSKGARVMYDNHGLIIAESTLTSLMNDYKCGDDLKSIINESTIMEASLFNSKKRQISNLEKQINSKKEDLKSLTAKLSDIESDLKFQDKALAGVNNDETKIRSEVKDPRYKLDTKTAKSTFAFIDKKRRMFEDNKSKLNDEKESLLKEMNDVKVSIGELSNELKALKKSIEDNKLKDGVNNLKKDRLDGNSRAALAR